MGKNNKNGHIGTQKKVNDMGRDVKAEYVKKAIEVLDYASVPVDEKLKKVKELLEKSIEK